ncbi:MAG TPA: mycofactocin-coupled SDR family oxidoreductase [Jatrophihabitantaceae bacterium]|jgi:SDR family mycofactocin-dependent oxidoreductase
MGKLDGKVAFITGAARGQGRSHAVRLAEEGANIIAVDLCGAIPTVNYPPATREDLEQTVKEVESTGASILASVADVRRRDELALALKQGVTRFGGLHVVVANAGVYPGLGNGGLCDSFVDATDTDLIGVMNTVAVSLPYLGEGASIVVTGSTAAMIDGALSGLGPGTGGYAWAKKSLMSYVEVLGVHLAPHSVRINAVHPTNVDTYLLHNRDVYRAFRPDVENPTREDAMQAFPAMHPMPVPFIAPRDVSNLISFLASDDASFVTGQNIRVDAGAMLQPPPV